MKKLIAALLVLTMVLALTGTVAMADCKFKVGDTAKFIKNAYAYKHAHNYNRTDTIVRKGSWAIVDCVKGDWVRLRLVWDLGSVDGQSFPMNQDIPKAWFKASDLKYSKPIIWEYYIAGVRVASSSIHVVYSQGGKNMSEPWPDNLGGIDDVSAITRNKLCHVKATAKVWMHKTHALKQNYGKALHKDDVVKFRHLLGWDTRLIPFYGIRYEGKNLWVSSEYSKLVK